MYKLCRIVLELSYRRDGPVAELLFKLYGTHCDGHVQLAGAVEVEHRTQRRRVAVEVVELAVAQSLVPAPPIPMLTSSTPYGSTTNLLVYLSHSAATSSSARLLANRPRREFGCWRSRSRRTCKRLRRTILYITLRSTSTVLLDNKSISSFMLELNSHNKYSHPLIEQRLNAEHGHLVDGAAHIDGYDARHVGGRPGALLAPARGRRVETLRGAAVVRRVR